MTPDSELHTAPVLWANLLQEYPIVAVTGVHYWPAPHGQPSTNIPLHDHQGMLLDEIFDKGRWPVDGFGPFMRRWENRDKRHRFALGSLVYVWADKKEGPPYDWEKLAAKYFCYEQEMSLKFMTETKIVSPMAVPLFDFDCINSQENLARIVSVMSENYKFCDWSILDSGGSFHLVVNSLVKPEHLPWHFGKLVKSFAGTSAPYRQHIFKGFGNVLMTSWKDHKEILRISNDMLNSISHYDEGHGKGIHFILDLRYLGHTIQELLRFIETREGSFGYIRISDKMDKLEYQVPPYVVADHDANKNIVNYYPFLARDNLYSQLRLAGI